MKVFIPNSYYKSVYDINYDKLKKKNIKCIMFDLDNTLALIDEGVPPKKVIKFIQKLNKDFDTYIISNNNKARIEKFCSYFDSTFVAFALKPMTRGFKEIKKIGNYRSEEMCMVGDQVMTDILGGNRFGCYTILVDPLGKKDLKITSVNRALEKIVLKKLTKRGILERGKYYE
jgi:HAD superfamily phosphatase (TIGR01668 family)